VDAGQENVVEADPRLLFEAVSNLLDNAIKFTARDSAVRISVEGGARISRLVVQDDGPGIPPEERSAVLRRFYRSGRDRLVPGSGLGLSVVSAIVRLHGFELILEDAEPGLRAIIDCGMCRA
jgi:signal transduction histidine kinase